MIIPAERKRLRNAALIWALGVALGASSLHDPEPWRTAEQVLTMIYCALAAIELWVATDPIWRLRERVIWALGHVDRALADNARSTAAATFAVQQLALSLETLGFKPDARHH